MTDETLYTRIDTRRWFIGGPSACAYVHKQEHIEPLISALCEITGDDNDDYTATLLEEENDND